MDLISSMRRKERKNGEKIIFQSRQENNSSCHSLYSNLNKNLSVSVSWVFCPSEQPREIFRSLLRNINQRGTLGRAAKTLFVPKALPSITFSEEPLSKTKS